MASISKQANPARVEAQGDVQEAEIRAALRRLLAAPGFAATQRRRAFLEFVVEETLAGRAHAIKGFTIAHAVFDRDESFDPKTDPVVRLEARRLRRDLDSYYVGPGAGERVRISIPKGGYAPLFEPRTHAEAPAPATADAAPAPAAAPAARTRRAVPVGALTLAGLVLGLAVGLGALLTGRDTAPAAPPAAAVELPRVAILPFRALDRSETTQTLADGLASELVLDLGRFEGLRLYAPSADGETLPALADGRDSRIPGYVVRGQVQTQAGRSSILVSLIAQPDEEAVWVGSYDLDLSPGALIDMRNTVAREIAATLGQAYGPLADDIRRRAVESAPESLDSYLCMLDAYAYRRDFAPSAYGPVLACLEAAVQRSPDYVDAWAMLGWLHLDAARYLFVPPDRVEGEYARALAAAEHAHALAPGSPLAAIALSSIHHHIGNYDEGERFGRMALALNPNDPDTLAQVGWRLAVRGKFEEGIPLIERAIARSVNPPGWYYHLPAIDSYLQGDYGRTYALAERAAVSGGGFSHLLVAIAAGALGDAPTAAAALDRVAAQPSLAEDPEGFLRRHGATDRITAALMAGIDTAERLVGDTRDR